MPTLPPFDGGSIVAGILRDSARADFPGLVLSPDDFLTLEHIAVLGEANGAAGQLNAVWNQLAVWYDERILRPQRLRAARERFRAHARRRGARVSVLKAEKPTWQRRIGRETKRFRWRETRPLPGYIPPEVWQADPLR